jgi:hypothetical protein
MLVGYSTGPSKHCKKTLKVALRPLYDGLILKKWLAMWKIVNFIQHFHILILIFDINNE